MDDAGRASERAGAWTLMPHAVAAAAFIASFLVIAATGTNRTDADFYLGITGYLAILCALISTLAVLIMHPWRGANLRDWGWLGLHVAGLAGTVALGLAWLGAHIA